MEHFIKAHLVNAIILELSEPLLTSVQKHWDWGKVCFAVFVSHESIPINLKHLY